MGLPEFPMPCGRGQLCRLQGQPAHDHGFRFGTGGAASLGIAGAGRRWASLGAAVEDASMDAGGGADRRTRRRSPTPGLARRKLERRWRGRFSRCRRGARGASVSTLQWRTSRPPG
jgi:hypothetical protein